MTVREAAAAGCDTGKVAGLTRDILTELLAYHPRALEEFEHPRVSAAARVNRYFQPPAAAALRKALADGQREMTLISAYRSAAQQTMLYHWYKTGRCGIPLASKPGSSNHEDGAAIDIEDSAFWRPHLRRHGWRWQGSRDPAHYSYRGEGFIDTMGRLGVLAFQRLWNHHVAEPEGKPLLMEDGVCGAATLKALLDSPADGWEGDEMEQWKVRINGTIQTPPIPCIVVDGKAYIGLKAYCEYADYAPPSVEPGARVVSFSTEKTSG